MRHEITNASLCPVGGSPASGRGGLQRDIGYRGSTVRELQVLWQYHVGIVSGTAAVSSENYRYCGSTMSGLCRVPRQYRPRTTGTVAVPCRDCVGYRGSTVRGQSQVP